MKNTFTKISFFILTALLFSSCNSTRRVPQGKLLLTKNEISINNKLTTVEEIVNLPAQKPNTKLLGYRFRLNMYSIANPNPDSTYQLKFIKNPEKYKRKAVWLSKKQVDRLGKSFWYHGIHDFLKQTGEPPAILDESRAKKTIFRLQNYYFKKGFFDVKATYKIDTLSKKKAKIHFSVITGKPYLIDSIKTQIKSPLLDSIYQKHKLESFLKEKQQYNDGDFENEKIRLTTLYRNNGVFYFQQNYVNFDIDTVNTSKKTIVILKVSDRNIRVNDSSKTEVFKMYKVNKVNVFIDPNASKNNILLKDSINYKEIDIFSSGKSKYRPKAISDAVFITKGSLFTDEKTIQTKNYLSNLQDFTYPNIVYTVDENKSNSLTANVYLNQKKKYKFGVEFGVTHSNIQQFGVGLNGSVLIRNIFHGAETLNISGRGNLGSSKDFANPDDKFFNVSEYGLDLKLSFPRIFFPIKFEKTIPKTMIPTTNINIGFAKQENIGLDKENLTGSIAYNWTPKKSTNFRFDLFNVQFVKNINTGNYFNVYRSSYDRLNQIAQPFSGINIYSNLFDGTNLSNPTEFINIVLNGTPQLSSTDFNSVRSIEERRKRLTQNDLILASSISFSKSTNTSLQDNDFYTFRTKLESAGNLLSFLANEKNKSETGNNTIFGVAYAQYLKAEFDYIKHWDLRGRKVFAVRSFFGIAKPYGNSTSVPFSRSYFAGGSNDNRAWQPYALGPGRSGSINDFNEANLKIAVSAELRFGIFNKLNGAIFADAGNIWNVFDNISDETSVFTGIKSLNDIALGSGFGFRYDLNYFVVRLDLGFKTYDPAISDNKKWFRDYNYAHSVINIGINYPF